MLNATPITTMDYTYDAVGNRKTANVGGVNTTYTYDAANQLHTSVDHAGLHTTYTYDGAGNMVSQNAGGTVTTHVYNGPSRLVEVQSPTAGDVTFVYDPDGRRVEKESTSENTRFVWDGERLLQENDTANEPQVQYTQSASGGGESGFGNLVSEYQSGTGTSYQHAFDGLGSTGALLDSSGSAVDRWQYSAFGLQQSAPADPPTRMTYAGQKGYQFDLELDLYYCRNRYYDPTLGRWLNQDPAKADKLNAYRYCGNNPVTKNDPSGLASPYDVPLPPDYPVPKPVHVDQRDNSIVQGPAPPGERTFYQQVNPTTGIEETVGSKVESDPDAPSKPDSGAASLPAPPANAKSNAEGFEPGRGSVAGNLLFYQAIFAKFDQKYGIKSLAGISRESKRQIRLAAHFVTEANASGISAEEQQQWLLGAQTALESAIQNDLRLEDAYQETAVDWLAINGDRSLAKAAPRTLEKADLLVQKLENPSLQLQSTDHLNETYNPRNNVLVRAHSCQPRRRDGSADKDVGKPRRTARVELEIRR